MLPQVSAADVVGADHNGCTDGVRLTNAMGEGCSVKCANGYGAAGSASVTCAADATDGAPPSGGLTCTAATFATPSAQTGRKITG